MTDVHTFRAPTMQAALDRVRQEMGAEAVILHTRQVPLRRLLPWRKARHEVEITASLGVNVRPPAAVLRSQAQTSSRAGAPVRSRDERRRERTAPDHPTGAPAAHEPYDGIDVSFSSAALHQAARAPERPRASHAPSAVPSAAAEPMPRPERFEHLASPSTSGPSTTALAEKLDAIQKMLENLGRAAQSRRGDEIPGELFTLYTDLIDAEVEDDLARDLVFRLKENCTPAQLADSAASRALLTALVESELRCSGPIAPAKGQRKVVALVGTTGVGKTTTIAKLAANFRLRDGVKMGLVTVDTYRIAAVEQLRTYAEIIDLPMKVVTSPPEMRRALDELTGLDLVLIDTAGRSPRDELQIQELKSLLSEAQVDEVHLVLSLTAGLRSLETTMQKFACANPTALVLTKLDEAAGMGALLSLARRAPLPVSYLTTGQDVPDDIEPARAARIARLILGEDRLT